MRWKTSLDAAIRCAVFGALLAVASSAGAARAETGTVRVATQFGLAYLPLIVMEHDHLWERQADKLGVKISAEYIRLGGGSVLNDALISDSVDMVAGGTAPMLVLWDRTTTSFKVKGVAALNSSPMDILTNKPNVKSLADFTADDRIAVPSIRTSFQALALMAAAERTFGPGQASHLDSLTVAMQHPDAVAALMSPNSPISGYVSSSPYQEILLEHPGIGKITDSFAAFGGPSTFSVVYAKDAFVQNNPKVMAAFYAALREAFASIAADRSGTIDKYLAVTHEKTDRGVLEAILARPDFTFSIEPSATLQLAQLMKRVGLLKQEPTSWKDFFVGALHAGQGS
ncbi:ABC transporter substrate-binding protein [Bradyrhizobium sp.]|uniref:ABC transporter substrate-binding protein n=1 Tax=Bradyrhizobium sp. TaxID=376 RepID=UPI003C57C20E